MQVPSGVITKVRNRILLNILILNTSVSVDLGVFRNPRYPLGQLYLQEYWKNIPISAPQEDADNRSSMYMIRNQVLLATLYPTQPKLREV